MQRRQLLKSMGKFGALGATALTIGSPLTAIASSIKSSGAAFNQHPADFKRSFKQALMKHPNLLGFANIDHDFKHQQLTIEGAVPEDIFGTFVRNGPAKHERGDIRYQHLFEGDGMLQQFNIADGKISHQGKFINTPKFIEEEKAEQFLYSGPDTKLAHSLQREKIKK